MIGMALLQSPKGGISMQKLRKPLSILLSLIMVFSVFSIVPFTAQAETANVWYYDRYWFRPAHTVTADKCYANAIHLQDLDDGIDDLYSGWYYSEGWKSFDDRVTIHGTVNIIITDNSYVRFDDGIHVGAGNTLNIYGQDRDDQYLEAVAESWDAAIGSDDAPDYIGAGYYGTCGTVTIEDGANIVYN